MSQILVVRDPQIELSEIVHTLRSPGSDESENANQENSTDIQQTKVFGLLMPLLAINNVSVDYGDVDYFELDDTGMFPKVKFRINDRRGIFKNFNHSGNDNELRVQILPPMDGMYKKVNLCFYITRMDIQDGILEGEAQYKLNDLTQARFKALGEKSTYELCDFISNETGLGFSCNTEDTEDQRYIQCQFESYKDILIRETPKSGSDANRVYDIWIDLWNNLILCDLYDRINSVDDEEEMMIYVQDGVESAMMSEDPQVTLQPALFTNHPIRERSDAYVQDFDTIAAPALPSTGNAVALSVYEENKKEWIDHYLADGDIEEDEFLKFEYAGEVYGDYNYLLAEKCRRVYLNKVKSEQIVIHLLKPQLGIMKGSQLRFVWYDNQTENSFTKEMLEEAGTIYTDSELVQQMGWLADWLPESKSDVMPMNINLQYSGQYTSLGQLITYDGSTQKWDSYLYLTRPAQQRINLMKLKDTAEE